VTVQPFSDTDQGQQPEIPDRRDRPGPEGQPGQHLSETAQVLLAGLDHHVSIPDCDRSPCSHRAALPTSRKDKPSAVKIAAATGTGYFPAGKSRVSAPAAVRDGGSGILMRRAS
jgi:hypothetical protein